MFLDWGFVLARLLALRYIRVMKRKVEILRGVPGCGKSTYTQGLMVPPRRVEVVSADHFFSRGGSYVFNPRLLGAAHDACFETFSKLMKRCSPVSGWDTAGDLIVVVDNTNTTVRECQRYVATAEEYGWPVEIVNIRCDPKVAAARNVHGVPADKVLQMHERLIAAERDMPTTWKQREVIQ